MKMAKLLSLSLMLMLSFPINLVNPKESKTVEPIPHVLPFAQTDEIGGITFPMPRRISYDIPLPPKQEITQVPIANKEIKAVPLATAPVIEQPKVTGITRTFVVTAYTAFDKGQDGKGITASGEQARANHTASCPKSLSFGTKLYIPSLNTTFTCEDRGSAIHEGRLDIYIPSLKSAYDFGRQKLEVIILGKGNEM